MSGTLANNSMERRRPNFRRILSSRAIYLLLLAAVILVVSAKDIAEPDVWWHMQNAKYLLTTHSFPSRDTYSFTAAGSPWLDHEWLSEIPLYLGYRAAGLRGLLLVYATVLVLIFALVFYRCLRAGADAANGALAILLAILLGEVSFGPRTILFGWLCMAALLVLLDRFRETGRGLWWCPPLFALWVNLHGSWVFGIAVLAIFVVCGLAQGDWGAVVANRWMRTAFSARETGAPKLAATIGVLILDLMLLIALATEISVRLSAEPQQSPTIESLQQIQSKVSPGATIVSNISLQLLELYLSGASRKFVALNSHDPGESFTDYHLSRLFAKRALGWGGPIPPVLFADDVMAATVLNQLNADARITDGAYLLLGEPESPDYATVLREEVDKLGAAFMLEPVLQNRAVSLFK